MADATLVALKHMHEINPHLKNISSIFHAEDDFFPHNFQSYMANNKALRIHLDINLVISTCPVFKNESSEKRAWWHEVHDLFVSNLVIACHDKSTLNQYL